MTVRKTVQLRVSPRELQLLREAVEEMLNDSDLIWGDDDFRKILGEYEQLNELLQDAEQTQVFTH